MDIALQLAINILIPALLFGLCAAGFSIFYSVSRIQHLAIGASISAAGYIFFALLSGHFSFPLAVVGALLGSLGIGLLCNVLVYEHLQKRDSFSSLVALISSVMLLFFWQSVILIAFGSRPKMIELPWIRHTFETLGATVTLVQMIAVSMAAATFIAVAFFLKYSKTGTAIRAVSNNKDIAEVVGINSPRIRAIAMILASLVAGIAGILIALEYNLEPYASNLHAVRAYGRTIVGGIGSVPGAIIASLAIDSADNIGSFFFSSSYREVYTFVFAFLFLLFRPQGLFGSRRE